MEGEIAEARAREACWDCACIHEIACWMSLCLLCSYFVDPKKGEVNELKMVCPPFLPASLPFAIPPCPVQ